MGWTNCVGSAFLLHSQDLLVTLMTSPSETRTKRIRHRLMALTSSGKLRFNLFSVNMFVVIVILPVVSVILFHEIMVKLCYITEFFSFHVPQSYVWLLIGNKIGTLNTFY